MLHMGPKQESTLANKHESGGLQSYVSRQLLLGNFIGLILAF
jgi:hypothetical protein